MSDNVKNIAPVLFRIKGMELMSLSLTLNKNDKNNAKMSDRISEVLHNQYRLVLSCVGEQAKAACWVFMCHFLLLGHCAF